MTAAIVASAVKKASVWLAKRARNVSKHVTLHQSAAAKHLTRPWVMSKAVHTVFRGANPKKLIEKTLTRFDRSFVQENGRVVLERMFEGPIGRNGERILRVVIATSGKIVTAFPVREFLAGAAALVFIDEVEAAANELEQSLENRQQALKAAEESRSFAVKAIEFIIDFAIDPSVANENEGLILALDRFHEKRLQSIIDKMQEAELQSFGAEQTQEIRTQYFDAMAGIAAPYLEG